MKFDWLEREATDITLKQDDAAMHAAHQQYTEFGDLFAQLGLPNSPQEIREFVCTHRPIPGHLLLAEAPCFTPSQAAFLAEKRLQDSPTWTILIDKLNALLREYDEPGC
mgnify:CR=1 FL=1